MPPDLGEVALQGIKCDERGALVPLVSLFAPLVAALFASNTASSAPVGVRRRIILRRRDVDRIETDRLLRIVFAVLRALDDDLGIDRPRPRRRAASCPTRLSLTAHR